MLRNTKRIIILLICFLIFFFLAYGIYLIVKPDPTCFDGKKNQKEEKIDCGGPRASCEEEIQAQPISVSEKAFVFGGQGKYDALAKISNPNNAIGSPGFKYKIILKGSSGEKLAEKEGVSFILPSETKNIIETGIESAMEPQDIDVVVGEIQWEEFIDYEKPELNIINKRFNLIPSGVGYGEAFGLLRNDSPFDFNFIKINVVLRDSSGNPVALNTTNMATVNSREQRDFRLLWPSSFPGEVMQVEMEAEADVYNSENFTKQFLPEKDSRRY